MPGDTPHDRQLKVMDSKKRRRLLQALSAAGVTGVAGCLGDDDGGDDDGSGDDGSGDDGSMDDDGSGDDGSGDDGSGDDGSGDDGEGDDGEPEELPEVELYDESGEQVTLMLMHNPGTGDNEDIAFQIQSDLARIGIQVEFMETSNILQELNSEPLPDENPDDFEYGPVGRNAGPPDRTRMVKDYDMLIGIGGNTFPRTPGDTEGFWTKTGAVNAYGYVPEADHASLYEEARQEPDQDRRRELFAEIFANLTEEAPANFLSQNLDFIGFRQDINTAPEFNEFGAELSTKERYRGEQSVSGDYTVLSTGELQTSYPPEMDDTSSTARFGLTHDGTWALSTDNQVIPLQADIEDSGDGQVYVVSLRDNLEFGVDADGNSFGSMTAEDFVFQIEMVHGVADNAADQWNEEVPPSSSVPSFGVVNNVEQTGELEFQVELGSVDPSFPLRPILWGDYCLPKGLYEKYMPDAQALRESTEIQEYTWTGNLGPYTFESATPGVTGDWTATRNDDYYMRDHVSGSNLQDMGEGWADAPYFNSYQYDSEEETATINERFRAGDGDQMTLETDVIEEFQQAVDSVRVEDTPSPFISMLNFNMRSNGHDLVGTVDGRAAICTVIDKVTITQDIQRGFSEPAVTWQPTWSPFYDDSQVIEYGVDVTAEDVQNARDMLSGLEGYELEEV